jgi:hypothetical protein
MVPIPSLWLPVLLSAVVVFLASWIAHAILPHHRGDLKRVPDEEQFLESMRRLGIPPGDYLAPRPASMQEMKNPAFVERRKRGPVVIMTVIAGGPPSMGRELGLWFLFTIVVGIFAAYITGHAVAPGAPYLRVMRFAGATAFFCYSIAQFSDSIWHKRSWATTFKTAVDGLLYGLLTGGVFGWLWPR